MTIEEEEREEQRIPFGVVYKWWWDSQRGRKKAKITLLPTSRISNQVLEISLKYNVWVRHLLLQSNALEGVLCTPYLSFPASPSKTAQKRNGGSYWNTHTCSKLASPFVIVCFEIYLFHNEAILWYSTQIDFLIFINQHSGQILRVLSLCVLIRLKNTILTLFF